MGFSNNLSAAELERLAILSEELAEAGQMIGKILRHGYKSTHPTAENAESNREELQKELGDVLHAIDRMVMSGDLIQETLNHYQRVKARKITQWLHHQN